MTALRPGGVAVVTGGASGIGLGIVGALREAGLDVEVVDLDPAALAAVEGPGIRTHRIDVSEPDGLVALAERLRDERGGTDVLVNNAGVGPAGAIAQTTLADWRWLLGINLMGVVHGVTAFVPGMIERGAPAHVVNTASMSALDPMPGLGAYAASKAAVGALTEALSAELVESGSPVRASLLVPANVRTRIVENSALLNEASTTGLGTYVPAASRPVVWRTPDEVGRLVARGIEQDLPVIVTHPEQWDRVEARHERLRQAFGNGPDTPIDL